MLELVLDREVIKYIKKSEKNLKETIRNSLNHIQENPLLYETLKGNLSGFHSYHFRYSKKEYRIGYYILDNKIKVILIGTRENFYSEMERKI